MRSILKGIFILCFVIYGFGVTSDVGYNNASADDSIIQMGDSSIEVLNKIYTLSNNGEKVLHSEFSDRITNIPQYSVCGTTNKICLAVEAVRLAISPYVTFAVFVILAIATILIVYNGFNLVIGKGDAKELQDAKTKITNIVIGVVIISGFVIIIRMLMSVVVMVTTR